MRTQMRQFIVGQGFYEPSSIIFERSISAGALGIHLDDVNICFRSLDIQD